MREPVPLPCNPDQTGDQEPGHGRHCDHRNGRKRRQAQPNYHRESGQTNGCHGRTSRIGGHRFTCALFAMETLFGLVLALVLYFVHVTR